MSRANVYSHKQVKVECGSVDPSYRGTVNPVLDAVYLQTEEERKTYEPIMFALQQEGRVPVSAEGVDSNSSSSSGI